MSTPGSYDTSTPPVPPPVTALEIQESTQVAGFPLQNGTPTILTWTAPNDGKLHYASFLGSLSVSVLEVGGAVNFQWTAAGQTGSHTLWAAGQAAGAVLEPANAYTVAIDAGSTVSVLQISALTSGAASVLGAIYGA